MTSTVTSCRYDPERGHLTLVQTVPTAPETAVRNYPSELVVSADGRLGYVANRGHNSVAVFAVDGDRLTARGTVMRGGDWPRHIAAFTDRRRPRDGHRHPDDGAPRLRSASIRLDQYAVTA